MSELSAEGRIEILRKYGISEDAVKFFSQLPFVDILEKDNKTFLEDLKSFLKDKYFIQKAKLGGVTVTDIKTLLRAVPITQGKITIKDHTNTPIGRFIARHLLRAMEMASKEAVKQGKSPFEYVIIKGGYCGTMYDSLHQPDKVVEFSRLYADAKKILPGVPDNQIENKFKEYLFYHVPSFLKNSLFRYSQTMSQKQNMEFLWMHITHINEFEDQFILKEQRVYININVEKVCEAVGYVAETVSEFINKNPQVAPYIFFKFKIRTNISEFDRADTCVCYIKLRKGLESLADKVLGSILKRLASIPQEYTNKMSSPVLKEIEKGVTTVDDNVLTDKGESYTSQITKTLFGMLNKHNGKSIKTAKAVQAVADEIISDTVKELRRRKYPY
jgi:hypothetical protein